ncbi:hypothetical protein SDC9_03594 [bioreactor metagenome]|uniref:Dihydroneopterin aldolase MtpD C-terminal domain-containing protein n=1 Tax=bioreactor metagenome TaxID=1076179 RepID=A0A644STW8_9ZZZZ|nr:dihydroneopterin aldolase family protein [Methanobrevibacter sp.]MEA4956205.1 dihydroneopterin aldolase family protein [Methanobrevibacter sp.]
MVDVEKEFFYNITNRERAIFEGAISMGALFHQFIGTPLNKETVNNLENAIENSLSLQPAIDKVEVKINLDLLEKEISKFDYTSLTGEMLDVKIYSKVNGILAIIRMKFIDDLNYPLMYVEEIKEDFES